MSDVWRLLPYHRGSTREHLARSDALVRAAPQPTVWWHATDRPTLILGATQKADEPLKERCRSFGTVLVRRQAGGTAVYASPHVLGLDIAFPAGDERLLPDVTASYAPFGAAWSLGLAALAIDSRQVSVSEARAAATPPGMVGEALRAACFGALSPHEVVAAGRKIVGLAQVRRRSGSVVQSGVHLRFEGALLAALLAPGQEAAVGAALHAAAAGLEELTTTPPAAGSVMQAVNRALEVTFNVRLVPGEWTTKEDEFADAHLPPALV